MSRKPLQEEIKTRDIVERTIIENIQTEKLVYPPPPVIVDILRQKKVEVTRQYIIRRYEEMGIHYENGLWVKAVENQ